MTLQRIEPGSIRLILEGSQEGFNQLVALFRNGQLEEVMGFPVQSIAQSLKSDKTLRSSDARTDKSEQLETSGDDLPNNSLGSIVTQTAFSETINSEIFQVVVNELQESTNASQENCTEVANRLCNEVILICSKSERIRASGEVGTWLNTLARHRLQQCLKYYRLGARLGRIELHSTLSAIVYRYIMPPQVQPSYQARLTMIEDFLQGFYIEALNAFRRENQLASDYLPRLLLPFAEYMAFVERYGKRRIYLPGRRNQQLIILRAQAFSARQSEFSDQSPEQLTDGQVELNDEDTLRNEIIRELMNYLEERNESDVADYLALRLQDLSAAEIEQTLGLTSSRRDYVQQRFKYHLSRFTQLSNTLMTEQMFAELDMLVKDD